jgi:hypothetical protein
MRRHAKLARMIESPTERFHVRMEGDRPIRLAVAEMTPDEALAAVAFQERELSRLRVSASEGLVYPAPHAGIHLHHLRHAVSVL